MPKIIANYQVATSNTGKEYSYIAVVIHTDTKDYEIGRVFVNDATALTLDTLGIKPNESN